MSCLALFGYLPKFFLNKLADFLCFILRTIRFRRAVILEHLRIAFPDYDEAHLLMLLREVYHHFAYLLVEDIALLSWSDKKLMKKCRVYNLDIVEEILASGKGFFVLAGHIGNWELGLASLVSKGYRAQTVVKEIKGEFGQMFVDKMRSSHNVGTILRSENAGRRILMALKNQEAVGFVLDQNMTADEGIFVDFFGRKACTMSGLALLSRRAKVPVVPIRFERASDGVHEIWVLPPVKTFEELSDRDEYVLKMTQECTHILELMIRLAPAQWLWMHRRWRTRPSQDF